MMKTAAPKPTPEAKAIKSALLAKGPGANAALAEHVGQTAGAVSQWATARRPVPPALATKVAEFLGLNPEQVSRSYAAIQPRVADERATYISGDLDPLLQRAPNDIRAINIALAVLVSTMVRHRPAEAQDAAAALRKLAPKQFRDVGLLKELIATLDEASAAKKRTTG